MELTNLAFLLCECTNDIMAFSGQVVEFLLQTLNLL